ncbi:MAG TPA: hypothetical protein VIN58_00360 [Roseateles sp.]
MKFQYHEQTAKRGDTGVRRRIGEHQLPVCRLGTFVVCLATLAPAPSQAVDGCTVLLCLAAPSWRSIEQCVPPVRQLLRDLARGKPFPTCNMAGAGNTATHAWSAAPDFCPPQYTRTYEGPNGPVFTCDYAGAISVSVDGMPFARTWWSMDGDSVTEFSPAAKSQLGSWDRRFDDEFAAWLAMRPALSPPLQ